jgi:mono/diheme cytochrome c family protein
MGLLLAIMAAAGSVAAEPTREAAGASQRGAAAVRGVPPMNPPVWTTAAFDNLWKPWGLKARPQDVARVFRERYGVLPADYDNQGLPMGFHFTALPLSPKSKALKGIVTDCLVCHAGRVAGQTIIGLPNASLDLQALFDDMLAVADFPFKYPMQFSHVRGTVDPVSVVAFLMEFRDADLNVRLPSRIGYVDNVCSEPPAWWLLKKKKTRNWTGGVDADAVRIDMVNLLSPFNSPDHIKKQEPVFADIHAFIMSVASPKFPFPVDRQLAAAGRKTFEQTCVRCHGTYGPDGKYPDKVVALETIGTDRVLADAITPTNLGYYNKSWFARELGRDGKQMHVRETGGYQAPPLDGIWATAPYLHNGSVPTVYHVLNSRVRPKFFTRSYGTGVDDYDPVKLGLKITVLDQPPDASLPGIEKRKIYDTTLPGRRNTGHTFGDELSEPERLAVIEYLKTL